MSKDRVTEILKQSKGFTNEVVSVLVETLVKEENPTNRQDAARALGNMGTKAREAIPVLGNLCLKDENPEVRRFALEALHKIVSQVGVVEELKEIISPIIEMIQQDKVGFLRAGAIIAADKMGLNSKELSKVIENSLQDPDPKVQAAAKKVLKK